MSRTINASTLCESLERRSMLAAAFRPPAVPLITNSPYLSIWSQADKLTDTNTVHWTGSDNSLVSLIRIDGVSYRLMGNDPISLAAFPQTGVQVLPTRSIYDFDNGHVHVTMTFMQPALASDLDALSLPLSYINWDVHSTDGVAHSVQVYDSVSSELSVNTTDHLVSWQRGTVNGLTTLRVGTTAQNYFSPVGDWVRIDWGYAYLVADASQITSSIGGNAAEINSFTSSGALSNIDDANTPRAVNNNEPVMAMAFNLGSVGAASVQRHVIVAYDEVKSISYFGESLVPYWARNGTTVGQMLTRASSNYASYLAQATAFDSILMTDMTTEGGSDYAQLGALAYRQTFAATGLAADHNGQLLAFPKENSSNGDISTVDVIYPMFPQLLLFSPTIAKATLQPVMDYSASSLWTFPNAPHDLGTYPLVAGRPDGGEAMPVEETANMLIMLDAIAKAENSVEYAAQFWPLVTQWASFLAPYADTPGLQLTTDDFLGVITNSTNLAAKAIIGLGAFADLATRMGDPAAAATYTSLAQADVQHWIGQSLSSDGTHWLLSYGQQGTSAQQYNLVWDKILGTNLFPASVAAKDIAYSKSIVTQYGVPIRSTTNIVGVDWSVWEASLATTRADFETLIDPIYNFISTTTNRLPFTDKYDYTNINNALFRARSVVGGVFAKMLANPTMWTKYANMDQATPGVFAGFPVTNVVLATAEQSPQTWRYTTTTPASGWMNVGFNQTAWSTGQSAFGTVGTPGLIRNTNWSTADIYLRRTFVMPSGSFSNLQLYTYHDEDVEIYINGVLAASASGYATSYVALDISPAAKAQLIAGNTITLAVHCHQTVGGQGVDAGLVNVLPSQRPGRISGRIINGKPGQTVFLDANNNGSLDSGEVSTTTTLVNVFNFSYVPVGAHTIRQILPPGSSQATPVNNNGIAIMVTEGAALLEQNFTNIALPLAPSAPDLLAVRDTGDSDSDNITSLQDLEFAGTAYPNSTVTLLLNGSPVAQGIADASGAYDILYHLAANGTFGFSTQASNTVGTGPVSATTNITVDTVSPLISNGFYDRDVSQDVSISVTDGRANRVNTQKVLLINLTTGLVAGLRAITPNESGSLATLDYYGLLNDGQYRLTFSAGAVTDVAGNASPVYTFYFDHLSGDANGDGTVDFSDLLTLAQHYGTLGNTFSTGNFNYSANGSVDFGDLLLLAQNYGLSSGSRGVAAAARTVGASSVSKSRRGISLAGLID